MNENLQLGAHVMARNVVLGVWIVATLFTFMFTSREADAALKHRYSFTANANDSVGGANGTVIDPTGLSFFLGGNLNLSGNNGELSNQAPFAAGAYVNLPNGIISALGTKGSFETWLTVSENRNWAEIFSFGQSRIDT